MTIESFLAVSVVGVGLSLVVEWLKKRYKTKPLITKFGVFALAILVGGGYVWLQNTSYLPTILTILTTASTVYAFFFKK